MKNSTSNASYVNDGEFGQLGRHFDLSRTTTILNNVPCSNINIKEIIGNYECSLLAKGFFDATGLPNYRCDEKLDLVHAVFNFIDGAWIDSWRNKLDVVVIDVMDTIFHLPKSNKFESFQLLTLLFINHIVKEPSTSSTVIISFDKY